MKDINGQHISYYTSIVLLNANFDSYTYMNSAIKYARDNIDIKKYGIGF